MKKKTFSLEDNGFEVFAFNKRLRKNIESEIKNNISLKLKLRKSSNFKEISKKIKKINDSEFKKLFGYVSQRYLSLKISKRINIFLKKNRFNRNYKKISLHKMSKNDLKHNSQLKMDDYCVYYRVVRQDKNDVSYPHRDSDFWKAHKYNKNLAPKLPFQYTKRLKVWFPIFGCNKKNSLHFFSYSHKKKIRSEFILKNGLRKPSISKNYISRNKKNIYMPIKNFDNQAVLFDDNCVHFAPKNSSSKLRISCEFTALVV